MRRTMVSRIALLTLLFVGSAFGLSGSQLVGDWTVIWDNSDRNQNEMWLSYGNGSLSGTYINDNKDSCQVSGNFDDKPRGLVLVVQCPKWEIRMEGTAIADGKTAKGDYWAYGRVYGTFTMTKHPTP